MTDFSWGAAQQFDAGAPLGGPAAVLVAVDDASRIGEARRAADSLAVSIELDAAARGTLGVVVTEAATNLARHARHGRMLLTAVGATGEPGAHGGVEMLALDDGPGIANVGRALEDGFSTGGTAGQGLGAMRRMAGDFDLYTRTGAGPRAPASTRTPIGTPTGIGTGVGTVLLARVWRTAPPPRGPVAPPTMLAGVVCVALAGERACGDAWAVIRQRDRTLVVLADGLGHGPDAALAASEAIRVIGACDEDAAPAGLIDAAHGALRATRGAALAVAAIDTRRGVVLFAGVGNIAATIVAPDGARSLASHNGTVGHVMRRVQEFSYPWPPDSTLVVHSDGLSTRWRPESYPGLQRHDPSVMAGVLFRDFARARDDATVVVVREAGA